MDRERLDILLVDRGIAPSRERARALIMAGLVMVDEQKVEKAGSKVPTAAQIRLLGEDLRYVSRGGLKLEKALQVFQIDLTGRRVLDLGASTGGFTDCALQHGACQVSAVDVGYGQLAWKLRQDERVFVLERTNARHLLPEALPVTPDVVTMDLSFISLLKVLPKVSELLPVNGEVICLIKPQFEAGRERIGKHGVIKDPDVHRAVLWEVIQGCQAQGYELLALSYSPVRGPEGNIEYLAHLHRASNEPSPFPPERIDQVVYEAHDLLVKKKDI